MEQTQTRSNRSPIVTFVLLPLLILLAIGLMYWFLTQCLIETDVYKKLSSGGDVLGVSTFDLTASKTQIKNNETVTYTAKVVTDDSDVAAVTGTIVFNLAGEGRIGEEIEGPGLCVQVSELRATCTAVNLLPSRTLTWEVPVTSKSTCSESATPTLTMVATFSAGGLSPEVSEDTAIVTCASTSTGSSSSSSSSSSSGSSGTSSSSSSGGTDSDGDGTADDGDDDGTTDNTLNSKDILAILKLHNKQATQCFNDKTMYLLGGLLVLLLLGLLAYFMSNRQTVVTETRRV
jgi:uncharacterized membrane protein YgcG